MEYSNLSKKLVSVLKFDRETMIEVSQDKRATILGIVALFIPPVVNLILASFAFPSGFGVMLSRVMLWPMLIPVVSIIGVLFLMNAVANKFFNGKGNGIAFFRTVSCSAIILWVTIIPFLLALFTNVEPFGLFNLIWLAGVIWILLVCYKMLLYHHQLRQQDAITVIVIGVIGYFIFRKFLGMVLVGKFYRFWY